MRNRRVRGSDPTPSELAKSLGLHEEKVAARRKKAEEGKPVTGADPKPPKSGPELAEESDETVNLTDPDSRVMRKNARSSYTQSLNCQISVDAAGSSLIVGQHTTQSASDINQLVPAMEAIPPVLGGPSRVLADAGYHNGKAIGTIEGAIGFRGFMLRGVEKMSGEWALVCQAFNVKRLHKLIGG